MQFLNHAVTEFREIFAFTSLSPFSVAENLFGFHPAAWKMF